MQTQYPSKLPRAKWDALNIEQPVRRFPETETPSQTIGIRWRPQPEVIHHLKHPVDAIKEYMRDYNVTAELTRSRTTLDYGYKCQETGIFNKHTPLTENHYIYPASRRIADRPPHCRVHGTTETRHSYTKPAVPARQVTDHTDSDPYQDTLFIDPPMEQSRYNAIEPLDTTHEGFEKYLDPYLTSSRLHHRPYTADQLSRPSVDKNIVTYYTCADVPWIRSPKPDTSGWRVVNLRPRTTCDREKFKQEHREIRTHNKLTWVPGTFRTEVRDNYRPESATLQPRLKKIEEEVKSYYDHLVANLPTRTLEEELMTRKLYRTENSQVGSRKPLCSVIDQHVEKNKKLERKGTRIGIGVQDWNLPNCRSGFEKF